MYGDLPSGQCSVDADCKALGIDGSRCDETQGVCVSALSNTPFTSPAIEGCEPPAAASARDCAAGNCAVPLSRDCTCLEGAWDDPDALVIGVLAPYTFASRSGETSQLPFVRRWARAISMALDEWRQELPEGRLQRSQRPLAVLHCNSNDDLLQTRRAMAHLTDVVQAPLTITLSDNDTTFIRDQAARHDTSIICSACFASPALAAGDTRLVWQIAPALVAQAPLAAVRVQELARLGAPYTSGAELTTVVSLSQDYPGINEHRAEVQRLLDVQGGYHQVMVQTPDPQLQDVAQLDVARDVIAAQPRVIVVSMDSDFTTYYLRLIENGWPADAPRPAYVLSYLNQELGLLADIVGNDDDLRRRISGTGWLTDADVALNLSGLEERFMQRYLQRLDQAQFGYDAFYAAAYAIAWADLRGSLDGAGVALGFEHLLSGAEVDVGPAGIKSSLTYLLDGQDIDLTGSTNRLDWQTTTHATQSDVGVWCLSRNADGSLALLNCP